MLARSASAREARSGEMGNCSPSIRSSLVACTLDGLFAEILVACFGATIVTAWAIELASSPALLGALAALPFLVQIGYLPAAWLTSRFGARRMALVGNGIARQTPLCLVALYPLSLPLEAK